MKKTWEGLIQTQPAKFALTLIPTIIISMATPLQLDLIYILLDIEIASDTYDLGWFTVSEVQFSAGKNLEAERFCFGLIDDVCIYNRAIIP